MSSSSSPTAKKSGTAGTETPPTSGDLPAPLSPQTERDLGGSGSGSPSSNVNVKDNSQLTNIAANYNQRNPAVKRLMKECQELSSNNEEEDLTASPLEDNLFEWHFTMRGPRESVYSGGIYHGRIMLPSNYPLAPPEIAILTPNGRFETGTKICLSISNYHPETWLPSWGIRTAVTALRAFMATDSAGAIGSITCSEAARKQFALDSLSFKCPDCGPTCQLLTPLVEPLPTSGKETGAAGDDAAVAAAAAAVAAAAVAAVAGLELLPDVGEDVVDGAHPRHPQTYVPETPEEYFLRLNRLNVEEGFAGLDTLDIDPSEELEAEAHYENEFEPNGGASTPVVPPFDSLTPEQIQELREQLRLEELFARFRAHIPVPGEGPRIFGDFVDSVPPSSPAAPVVEAAVYEESDATESTDSEIEDPLRPLEPILQNPEIQNAIVDGLVGPRPPRRRNPPRPSISPPRRQSRRLYTLKSERAMTGLERAAVAAAAAGDMTESEQLLLNDPSGVEVGEAARNGCAVAGATTPRVRETVKVRRARRNRRALDYLIRILAVVTVVFGIFVFWDRWPGRVIRGLFTGLVSILFLNDSDS